MLAISSVITGVLLILIFLSFAFEWENIGAYSLVALVAVVFIFWLVIGFGRSETAQGKVVKKDKYEILIGEDKIIITNLYDKKITQTFEDAATYNLITHNRDKYYLEIIEYDMYGFENGHTIVIKDERYTKKY